MRVQTPIQFGSLFYRNRPGSLLRETIPNSLDNLQAVVDGKASQFVDRMGNINGHVQLHRSFKELYVTGETSGSDGKWDVTDIGSLEKLMLAGSGKERPEYRSSYPHWIVWATDRKTQPTRSID